MSCEIFEVYIPVLSFLLKSCDNHEQGGEAVQETSPVDHNCVVKEKSLTKLKRTPLFQLEIYPYFGCGLDSTIAVS